MALAYLLDPNQQYIANGGVPNVGGLIKVYLNGTDDPAVTYSDFEGTANPFPVVLDSNGRAVVIADESKAYRVEVYGALGNLLWTSYPVVPRTYTQNNFTNADKEKLDSIEEGAQKNVQSDWAQTDSSADDFIKNKPDLDQYAEKDELAQVAFSGDYDDLENRPSIPPAQVQSDWSQANVSDPSYIRNRPNLAAVATSGSYNDLNDAPNIPPPQVPADWDANSGVTQILNKPDIPGMAQTTAAALCELQTNIEDVEAEIPDAQVQADYAQANPTAVDFIKNKPDLSLKEDVSNKATDTIDPTSTTQYPSSKAMADFTNSAIATNTGKYISDEGNPFTSDSDLPTDPSIVSNNDYAVVITNGIYYRYKATVTGSVVSWAMEYAINTNAFTPAQQDAIDSTVTAVKVGNYDAHIANTTIHVTQADKNAWNGKQDAIDDLNTIRNGASAGATAVQPATLAEKAEVTAAALCQLNDNLQNVEESIPDAQVQSDWNETDPGSDAYIKNKPDMDEYAKLADLAAVAFSGDYDDLSGKPDLSVFARSADLAAVATSGSYYDLTDRPNFAAVATSGSYDDLVDKPSIPAAQVNSDWNANSGVSQILNKPNLAAVATSGDYNDLENLPTIPAAQVNSDWNSVTGVTRILNKPDLSVYALVANLVTNFASGNISDTKYPSSKAVDDALKSFKQSHVEALRIPVNPEQYGFVDVGMYQRGYHKPVFVPTTYSTARQTYYIGASDFSALILTPNVFNPTVVYGCEEFYVDYYWTSVVTDYLSLYDFFTSLATDTLRHFVLTINNYCQYAMTLKIWGGHNKPDIDIYSNIRAMTHTLEVACAANRVTRIDVRLCYLEVNTSGSKSVVVTVT